MVSVVDISEHTGNPAVHSSTTSLEEIRQKNDENEMLTNTVTATKHEFHLPDRP
jgi:hypothetical protein